MVVRDFKKTPTAAGTFAKLNNPEIIFKEFGQQDNNGLDSMTWHNREKDWYNAERRFIFAAPNRFQRAEWIKLITTGKNKATQAKSKKIASKKVAKKRVETATGKTTTQTKQSSVFSTTKASVDLTAFNTAQTYNSKGTTPLLDFDCPNLSSTIKQHIGKTKNMRRNQSNMQQPYRREQQPIGEDLTYSETMISNIKINRGSYESLTGLELYQNTLIKNLEDGKQGSIEEIKESASLDNSLVTTLNKGKKKKGKKKKAANTGKREFKPVLAQQRA